MNSDYILIKATPSGTSTVTASDRQSIASALVSSGALGRGQTDGEATTPNGIAVHWWTGVGPEGGPPPTEPGP